MLERIDVPEAALACQAQKVRAVNSSVDSAQNDSSVTLGRLSRGESDGTQLVSEVEVLRGVQRARMSSSKQLSHNPTPKSRPSGNCGLLRADSLIIGEFPLLFDEFRRKRFALLWRAAGMVSAPPNSTAARTL
jgi:hypothetical protein